MQQQKGFSLSGFLFWGVVVALVGMLGLKILATRLDEQKLQKVTRTLVAEASPGMRPEQVRQAFDKFAVVEKLPIAASDLEIIPYGERLEIRYAYEKRLPLAGNVSLVISYQGSTAAP